MNAGIRKTISELADNPANDAASSSPTVFIVDDDPAVRDAIGCLVESVGLRCRLFSSGQEFLDVSSPSLSGCMILDVRMAGISGLELQEKLRDRGIEIPIIIVSGHGDIPMAVQAMKHGAMDFLEKPFRNQTLLDLINRSMEENAKLCCERSIHAENGDRYAQLTAREKQVFELLVEGKATKLIAHDLNLSPRTIEVHRAHIMEKIGAQSASDLVRFAYILRGNLVQD